MTPRTPEAGTIDLIDLAAELRRVDLETGLELALALRKAGRPRRQERSRRGWKTRRAVHAG